MLPSSETATGDYISIDGVGKDFGTFRAIDSISMDIGEGEFFSLLGASGCGKTTLLRMLAGFENPTRGDIRIDGQSVAHVPPFERPVNMVFQNYAIFPHLNVQDNIAYGLRKLKVSKTKKLEMVEEMLDLVQLQGYGARKADQLSGGQRQRIALARALILRPKVLLLDEPLGALDKQLREKMQVELRRLQRSVGITFVFVTHDQEEALTLSDRIAVMSGGDLLQVDTPDGLYERPRTREVASFIGNMNFIGATVKSRMNGHAVLSVAGNNAITVDTPKGKLSEGDRLCLAIRPERLSLAREKPIGQAVPATVEVKSYLGERSQYHVRLPDSGETFAVSAQNIASSGLGDLSEGASVWLSWNSDDFIVLDKGAS